MRHCLTIFFLSAFLAATVSLYAEEGADTHIDAEDEKVIAVLEVLELMEMVNDLALFKDMEYIKEEKPNESQD